MTIASERGHTHHPDAASWYLHSHKRRTEESPGSNSSMKVVGEVILREPWAHGYGREVAQQSLAHHVSHGIICPDRGACRVLTQSFAGKLLFRLTLPNLLTNVPPGKEAVNWAPRALLPLKRKAEFPGSCERWIQDPHTHHSTDKPQSP